MFKNYLLVSLRNLLRNKIYSSISILGLVISIAASILIFSYVGYENSYDRFFPDYENIYRISLKKFQSNEESMHSAMTYTALNAFVKENFPEVKSSGRIAYEKCLILFDENRKFNDQEVFWADQSFLDVFQFQYLQGSKEEALIRANTAIISRKASERFFGSENPVGKTVLLNEGIPFLIVAEVENLPENSHFSFDFLLSLTTGYSMGWASDAGDWKYNWVYTYIKVNEPFEARDFEKKLNENAAKSDLSQQSEDIKNEYQLQELKNIHLDSALSGEMKNNGNRKLVYSMGLISILILIIAWINFINLCTARALERAKETGVRKVIGAGKTQLISQYLFESLLLNLLSGIIAFFLAKALTPWFSGIVEKPISENIWTYPSFWAMYVSLFIVGSLISGIYPALVLSGFDPLETLKSRSSNSAKGNYFRKILVVFQFTITLILISATLIVYLQFKKMITAGTGINYNQVLVVKAPRTLNLDPTKREKFLGFREQIISYHAIKEVSASNPVPGEEVNSHNDDIRRIDAVESNHQTFSMLEIDNHFLELYNIKLSAGQDFSEKYENDTSSVLVNEKACAVLGFEKPELAVGSKLLINKKTFEIKGVISDFYQEGMKKQVAPAIFFHNYNYIFGYYSVRLNSVDMEESIRFLKDKWEANFPKDPFDYFFEDNIFAKHYEKERQAGKIFAGFTVLAILIACLGLLGLVSYMAIKRTKEIGLRKVLGAPIGSLFMLLVKDFAILIGISFVIGLPLSYIIMDSWLASYPFRISLTVGLFLIPALVLIISAFVVTAYTILKVSYSNPVEALGYE